MEIQQLHAFHEVAKELSFTRAAGNMHYAQSSITAKVKNLEESLGTRLFDRSGRTVQLTEAGRRLQPYALRLFDLVEEIQRIVPDGSATRHRGHGS